ncbi:MAG: hypothetical protein QM758_00515 [Armatimonas sp.]
MCEYAEGLAALYDSPRQSDYFDGILAEQENLQAALEYAIGSTPTLGARLAGTLWRHWERAGKYNHGLELVERLRAVLPETEIFLHALLEELTARLNAMQFRYAQAIPHYKRSKELYGEADDSLLEAMMTCQEAAARRETYPHSDHNESFALFKVGQAVVEAQGTLAQKATYTLHEGYFHARRGEEQSARDCLERGLTLFRIVGSQRGMFLGLHWLAYAAYLRNDKEVYLKLQREAMEVAQALGDASSHAIALWNLSLGLNKHGDPRQAEQLCHTGLTLTRQRGMGMTEVLFLTALGKVHVTQDNPAEARRWFRAGLKQADITNAIPHLMLSMSWLTRLALREAVANPTPDSLAVAAHLWGVLHRLEELLQLDQQYDFDGPLDELVASVEASMGKDAFAQERDKAKRYERAEALLIPQLYPAEEAR